MCAGVCENQRVKAKITLEILKPPCVVCGKLATSNKECVRCRKTVCNDCVKIYDASDRYCTACYRNQDPCVNLPNDVFHEGW